MNESNDTLQVVTTPKKSNKGRDNDGLHKRRGIWHFKLKVAGRWREISARTSNYAEARKIRHDAVQAQREGRLPSDMAKWPFERAAAHWLKARTEQVSPEGLSPHTIVTEKSLLNALCKGFGGRKLGEIAIEDIRAYRVARGREVGSRCINLEMRILRMILRSAKLWARLADDYKPLPEKGRGPGRALSADEEKRLFEVAASNPDWEAAYLAGVLAAHTTARSEELRGLRLKDVDVMDSRTMTIRRSTTKTDAGCRVVPLDNTATWALARLLDRAARLGSIEPEHYVFPFCRFRQTKNADSASGTGYDPTKHTTGWRSAWESLREKAGLPTLRFHDLRHHCITRLAESGTADHVIMSIAGHVSREMLEHYSHIRMEAKRAAVATLDAPVDSASQQSPSVAVN